MGSQRSALSAVTGEDEEQITHNFLWAKGKFWATVRAGAEPLFHSKSLKSYSPLMHQSIDTMLAALEKKGSNAVVDVRKPFAGVTLSIVGRAAFGEQLHQINATTMTMRHLPAVLILANAA